MIPTPSGVRVWLATGHTDMRRGMNSLALQVQERFQRDPQTPPRGDSPCVSLTFTSIMLGRGLSPPSY